MIEQWLSIDKYKTPSQLLYYFLNNYGNHRLNRRDTISICELASMFMWSCLGCLAQWTLIGLLGWIVVMGIVSSSIAFQFGIGVFIKDDLMGFHFIFFWTIILAVIIGVGLGYLMLYLQDRKHEKERIAWLNRDITVPEPEPSVLRIWVDSIKNKVCYNIDLNKFR